MPAVPVDPDSPEEDGGLLHQEGHRQGEGGLLPPHLLHQESQEHSEHQRVTQAPTQGG